MFILWGLLACGEPEATPPAPPVAHNTAPTTDTEALTAPDTTAPTGLHGQEVSPPLAALDAFTVINRHGATMGPSDLLGTPTVMWFYPAAATGG